MYGQFSNMGREIKHWQGKIYKYHFKDYKERQERSKISVTSKPGKKYPNYSQGIISYIRLYSECLFQPRKNSVFCYNLWEDKLKSSVIFFLLLSLNYVKKTLIKDSLSNVSPQISGDKNVLTSSYFLISTWFSRNHILKHELRVLLNTKEGKPKQTKTK